MCGRYALFTEPGELADAFDLRSADYEPTYNAAPSERLPVILDEAPETVRAARWGLVPSWSDGPRAGPDPINARAERLAEAEHFRAAYRERRCLVPVDGFYEWAGDESGSTPYFFAREDGEPFLLAGLWETWTPAQTQTGLSEFGGGGRPDRDPDPVRSFAVVTTEPNGRVADYHDRMPVVLDRDLGDRWLAADDPGELLAPREFGLAARRVPDSVNDPANDRPELVEPVS
ncbi:MAG: SOS response-associated peptidase [Halobacterium sp.]